MFSKILVLFLCVCGLVASGPKCKNSTVVRPEVRQQILDFHIELGRPLNWSCKLERKAYRAFELDKGLVNTNKINRVNGVNEYSALSSIDNKTNVEKALYYWWEKNQNAHAKMANDENTRIGCASELRAPMYHLVCVYN
ncbi:SCP-like protein [Ancylostoma ceylanicum]|uniref:SCP-like protein n=1 Tax=Ancylostoma ceylanicum TaxID=53326 RepID=A0A0D6LXS3_9BILA|nr:SCP-like protein [Ancylostoma ceylanicum]